MIPSSFTYQKVKSVEEAIGVLNDSDRKILAGGHSLIPTMKLRLNSPEEFQELGAEEYLTGEGVCLIEWSDRIAELLPQDRIDIRIKLLDENERELSFWIGGERSAAFVKELAQAWSAESA